MQIRVVMKPGTSGGGFPRKNEPVSFGVPLPKGFARPGQAWRLVDNQGNVRPVQTCATDCWPDGSVRWLLADTQVDTTGTDTEYRLEPCAQQQPVVAIVSRVLPGGLVVDTGVIRATFRKGDAFPVASLSLSDGTPACECSMPVVSGGMLQPVIVQAVRVEFEGPLRTVVRIDGTISQGSASPLTVTARVHFYAGLPTVRFLLTMTNPNRAQHKGGFWDLGDQGSILLKDVSVIFRAPRKITGLAASPETAAAWMSAEVPFELYQDSSGGARWQSSNHINRLRQIPTSFRGYRLRSGRVESTGMRATPRLRTDTFTLSVPQFWQNFPKSLEATEQQVRLRLFPEQFSDLHELQGGEQKTHELFLAAGTDRVTSDPLAWTLSRVVACVEPEHLMASKAVSFLAPLTEAHAALVNTAIEGKDSFESKREIIDEYGWRHFGEIYGDHESVRQLDPPLVSHYNNQYDALAGFAYQFMRTGDARWWQMAAELAWHVIDIDIYHTIRDRSAYNGGLFWHTYHYGDADTATHRTYPRAGAGRTQGGGPSADHNYTTGLMLHYFLTGEQMSRDAVVGLAAFVLDIDDGRKTILGWIDSGDTGRAILSAGHYEPGRSPANSLNALLDGHRLTGEPRFLDKAEVIVRRVVHPEKDVAAMGLENVEAKWFYTMFLQSLGKYLDYRALVCGPDAAYGYAQASLLNLARWMAEHERPYLSQPEKLEFPTETWAAQDIRKSDALLFAAFHAAGQEKARFAERGFYFHDYSVKTLASMPTRAFARPVIVMLTSGFMASWFQSHAEEQALRAEQTAGFGAPDVFIPQRERAKKRLVYAAGLACLITVSAAVLLLKAF